jgi:DNA-directed RNA polymerase specialized sigma24 family protein
VADTTSGPRAPDDATLLNQVRTGDPSAFGVLYQRHFEAVQSLARELVPSPAEADHLVAETFALVHEVTQSGGGPTDAFRPYVLTALRRAAGGKLAEPAAADPGEPIGSPRSDGSLVTRAFLSLPERWRAVLWHAEIEQATPESLAPLLGVTAGGVAELDLRAREGLRQAVVRTHLADHPECVPAAERLDAYERGVLAESAASNVAAHLSECASCSAAIAALADLTAALRADVAPVYLGSASAAYLAGRNQASPAGGATGTGANTQELAVTGAAAGAPSLLYRVSHPPRRGLAGAGAVLGAAALVAIIALAWTGSPHSSRPGDRPVGADAPLGVTASASPADPSRSARPSPTARPKPSRTARRTAPASSAPPSPSPAPDASLAASPAPAAQLTVAISLQGGSRRFVQLPFQVGNTGNAATGAVTAAVTLPAGSWLIGGFGRRHGGGGWTCQPDSTGASCQHAPISAGAQAPGVLFVIVGRSACGQPVGITASSGSASASAQSADIQCGSGR